MIIRDLIGTNKIVKQNKGQSFNLDTILLANFIKITKNTKKIIDVGTGNGSLMLYLSEKTTAKIIGIEIQEQRYQMALENIKLNQLEHQLSCYLEDYNEFNKEKHVDMIVTNPPFFKTNEMTKTNLDIDSQIARHEIKLNLEQLILKSSKLLKHGGSFYMIHRPDRLTEIMLLLNQYELEPKEICLVYPYLHKNPNHVLIKAVKKGNKGLKILPPFILYKEKHIYSEQLIKLYGGKEDAFKFTK